MTTRKRGAMSSAARRRAALEAECMAILWRLHLEDLQRGERLQQRAAGSIGRHFSPPRSRQATQPILFRLVEVGLLSAHGTGGYCGIVPSTDFALRLDPETHYKRRL